ncbi:MAG: RDD family protein, partial [Actinomycetota bacterium]
MIDPAVQQPAYAGLGQRGLAVFLDSLIWLFFIGQVAANIPESVYEDQPVVVGVIFLALFSAAFNYFWLTEWKWGKTLGKAICSIHVTDEDGGRPAFGPTTIRNLLRLVDVVVIGPLLIANTPRHQRLGDRFAHTIVVRDQPARATAPAKPHPANPVPATSPAQGITNPATAEAGASERHDQLFESRASESGARRGSGSPWAGKGIGVPPASWTPLTVLWGVLTVIGLLVVEAIVVSAFDPDLESLGSKLAVQALL